MFSRTTPAVKNLIIINVLIALLGWFIHKSYNLDINSIYGLYYYQSPNFHFWQYITYMFLHAPLYENMGFFHVLFNMYALFLFGTALEQVWGSKRFLIFYFICGIGAALIYTLVNHLEYLPMIKDAHGFVNTPSPELLKHFVKSYLDNPSEGLVAFLNKWTSFPDDQSLISESKLIVNSIVSLRMNTPCVGASGAIFGILLGFGMLFPNTVLMLLFPPIPLKAKYFVMIYGGIELFLAITQPGSSIAHTAHLGGMLFGYIMIKMWNRDRRYFY
jgi:membrane associated rhomboid family serine protease